MERMSALVFSPDIVSPGFILMALSIVDVSIRLFPLTTMLSILSFSADAGAMQISWKKRIITSI